MESSLVFHLLNLNVLWVWRHKPATLHHQKLFLDNFRKKVVHAKIPTASASKKDLPNSRIQGPIFWACAPSQKACHHRFMKSNRYTRCISIHNFSPLPFCCNLLCQKLYWFLKTSFIFSFIVCMPHQSIWRSSKSPKISWSCFIFMRV